MGSLDRLDGHACLLYASKSSSMVNRLRNDLFSAKKGEVESHQLPPCIDYFVKHKQRANYQVAVCRKCLHQDQEIPSPVD